MPNIKEKIAGIKARLDAIVKPARKRAGVPPRGKSTKAATKPAKPCNEVLTANALAGRVFLPAGDPMEVAWHAACIAKDIENDSIVLIHSVHADHVWYLAMPSADTASTLFPGTRIAKALPGMPGHCGPGMYVHKFGFRSFGVLVLADGIQSYVGEMQALQGLAAERGLNVFFVSDEDRVIPWLSIRQYADANASRVSNFLTLGGLGISVACLAGWVAMNVAMEGVHRDTAAIRAALSMETEASINNLNAISARDVPIILKRFDEISVAIVQKGKGSLLSYRVEKSEERIEAMVPVFGGAGFLASYGTISSLESKPGESMGKVTVTRNLPAGQ
jgi:hypothetical protein